MADDEEHSPSFDLPSPSHSLGGEGMEQRIAARLFPSLAIERSDRSTPHYVAHYRVLRKVGRGGMGVVHAAEDQKLGRVVAIKLLHRRELSDQGRRRLLDEARSLAKLSHPNVVQIFEIGEQAGEVFIAMEFVEGETLAAWQREHRRRADLLAAYLQAGAGLAAAHRSGIVHCDFKPANVLVGRDGRVRVADFGLARMDDNASTDRIATVGHSSSSIAYVPGTPGYAAPELFAGRPATASSDQFGFCVALWEALSGIRPFENSALTHGDETRDLPAPRGSVRPRWLRRALLRGLAADVDKRWPTLEQLLRHIERRLWLRRIGWVFPVLLVTAGLALANLLREAAPVLASCESANFESAWGEERKQQLLEMIADDPAAVVSARAIATELDWYASSWAATQRQLCEDHFDHAQLSAEGFDLAQSCLDDARSSARALVDSLVEDGIPTAGTAQLLDSLPLPHACRDVRLQRSHSRPLLVRLGIAATIARPTQEIELKLARGEFAEARRLASELIDSSPERLGLESVRADALLSLAMAEKQLGELDAARTHFERAALELEHAELPEQRFRALQGLAELLAWDFDQPEAAALSLTLADAPLVELGNPDHLVSDARITEALIAETVEDHPRAELLLRDALAMQERAGVAPRQLARTRLRIANSLANQGRRTEALALYDDVLERMRELLDAAHPDLAAVYFDIGLTWAELEQWEDAQHFLELALAIKSRSFAPDSIRVARVEAKLADVEIELGHDARAFELAEQAAPVLRSQLPAGHPDRVAAQATYAWTLLQAQDYAGALAANLEVLDALGPAHDQYPAQCLNIGWLLCRQQRCGEAESYVSEALRSSEPIVQAKARMLSVEIALEHDPKLARAQLHELQAEWTKLSADQIDAQMLAEFRWLVARVAMLSGEPRSRIAKLVSAAEQLREHLQPDQLTALHGARK